MVICSRPISYKKHLEPRFLKQIMLTAKESELLRLIADGAPNKQAAFLLGISHNTVHNKLHIIFSKLGAADRTNAVALALRNGIIQ